MSATAVAPTVREIALWYKEGSSDKVYQMQITGTEEEGYTVAIQFGKRGQALQSQIKNKVPVDLDTATALFEEQENKKMAKGYTPIEGGVAYQGTPKAAKYTGLLPQLLNDIEEEEALKLLYDDDWVAQEKYDGERKLVNLSKGKVEGSNRKGLVTAIPSSVEAGVREFSSNCILDGELIGETYHVFDALAMGKHALADKEFEKRIATLVDWGMEVKSPNIKVVGTAVGTVSKLALWKTLKERNAEGIVFIKKDSIYKAGKSNDRLKFKFYATASVRVKCQNDKSSFQMEVLSKGEWVFRGNCTVTVDKEVPKPGSVVEVKYLYAYPEPGSLYQPSYLGVRTDIDQEECLESQLKYKPEQAATEDN